MKRRSVSIGLFLTLALTCIGAPACKKSPDPGAAAGTTTTTPQGQATIHAAQVSAAPVRTGQIETFEVPNDRKLLLVLGEEKVRKRPIVHLHGMCAEAHSDLQAWAASASTHGTVIALTGDSSCPGQPGMSTWTMDARAIDARIGTAIQAIRSARGIELDDEPFVVIGESMGASRATALANLFPAKYTRLVLVGAPEVPSVKALGSAKAIALGAGEKEPQDKMRRGLSTLEQAGLAVRFFEFPEATHGEYGPVGNQRMSEAIAFVADH